MNYFFNIRQDSALLGIVYISKFIWGIVHNINTMSIFYLLRKHTGVSSAYPTGLALYATDSATKVRFL